MFHLFDSISFVNVIPYADLGLDIVDFMFGRPAVRMHVIELY